MTSRLLLVALALGLVACEQSYPDGLPPPPSSGSWIEVEPGGDTTCARGTPYRFFVRGGDPSKIIIDFQGGGACWNAETCGIADSLFRDEVGHVEEFTALLDGEVFGGVFDREQAPFADWTIIHIPYCPGDIHWGNARAEDSPELAIEHRGYVNVSSALDWVYARYGAPEQILVSGCSAGAYGAALHSAYVAEHYPAARVAVAAGDLRR